MSKILSIFPFFFMQYMGLCLFSLSNSLMIIVRICALYLIISIKLEVWSIYHCLGLGHETMVCAVCLSIFRYIGWMSADWKHPTCRTNHTMGLPREKILVIKSLYMKIISCNSKGVRFIFALKNNRVHIASFILEQSPKHISIGSVLTHVRRHITIVD